MAHFMVTAGGSRGDTSRLGSKSSGLFATLNGWDGGVRVSLYHDNGQDMARVTLTSGSGYSGKTVELYDGPIDATTRELLSQQNAIAA